jgi:3'-phosphoadenosine 5'-phosphosulfate sulfotransferase (PAPS reductase)/FAD synthetase
MLSKIARTPAVQPPLIIIIIDTLYHFSETYALAAEVEKRYGIKGTKTCMISRSRYFDGIGDDR